MYGLKQSTALDVLFFLHDASGDAVTGKVDGDFSKNISKNAGAFSAMTVTITERAGGWYLLPLSAAHTDTLGILTIYLTVTGGKQVNLQFRVTARYFDDQVDANVTAMAANVLTATAINAGAITAAKFAVDAIDSTALSASAAAEIADKILGRTLSGGADGGRTVTQALRSLRNKVDISGGTMTVYQENDVTSDWTAAVTTTAGNPITTIDPA